MLVPGLHKPPIYIPLVISIWCHYITSTWLFCIHGAIVRVILSKGYKKKTKGTALDDRITALSDNVTALMSSDNATKPAPQLLEVSYYSWTNTKGAFIWVHCISNLKDVLASQWNISFQSKCFLSTPRCTCKISEKRATDLWQNGESVGSDMSSWPTSWVQVWAASRKVRKTIIGQFVSFRWSQIRLTKSNLWCWCGNICGPGIGRSFLQRNWFVFWRTWETLETEFLGEL